jgi:hypothetical protein
MSLSVILGFAAVSLVMISIPALLAWSGSRRRSRVGRTGGVVVLRMPRGHHAIMASIVLLPSLGAAGLAFVTRWSGSESNGWILGGVLALAGLLAGGYFLALEAHGALRLDDAGLERVGAVGRLRAAWADVARLTFNPVNQWFFLTLASGKRVYVVSTLDGIADFGELALAHLPKPVLDASPEAVEALRELAAS